MNTPWTRLEGGALWNKAEAAYRINGGIYHGFEHPMSMYGYAKSMGIPYDPDLDEAILAHDVIINLGHVKNESASADWLDKNRGAPNPLAREMIMTTACHSPRLVDDRLAVIDLMNLAIPRDRDVAEVQLYDEARLRPGFELGAFLTGSIGYLQAISATIGRDLKNYRGNFRTAWERIEDGVAVAIAKRPAIDPAFGQDSPVPGLIGKQILIYAAHAPAANFKTVVKNFIKHAPGAGNFAEIVFAVQYLQRHGLVDLDIPDATFSVMLEDGGALGSEDFAQIKVASTTLGAECSAEMLAAYRPAPIEPVKVQHPEEA